MKTDPDKIVEKLIEADELWYCANCDELFDDPNDLNEDELCDDCAEKAEIL